MDSSVYALPAGVRSRIPDWKRNHRHVYSMQVETGEEKVTCIFRVLTREEMRYIEESEPFHDPWWSEGWIIGHCLLYPDAGDLDEWAAGAVAVLGNAIVEASGWASADAIKQTLDQARMQAGTLDAAMVSYILKAFPSMKAEDLGPLHFIDLMYYVAKAEVILGQQLDVDMWLDTKGFERKLRRARKQQYARPFVPRDLPVDPAAFQTPAEQMFTEADLRRKPQLRYMPPEAVPADKLIAHEAATNLRGSSAIMEEMAAQRAFLQGE